MKFRRSHIPGVDLRSGEGRRLWMEIRSIAARCGGVDWRDRERMAEIAALARVKRRRAAEADHLPLPELMKVDGGIRRQEALLIAKYGANAADKAHVPLREQLAHQTTSEAA